MPKVKWSFLQVDRCKVSLNFSGKFCIVIDTVGKKVEMIDIHQNLRVLCRLFCAEGREWLITAEINASCVFF